MNDKVTDARSVVKERGERCVSLRWTWTLQFDPGCLQSQAEVAVNPGCLESQEILAQPQEAKKVRKVVVNQMERQRGEKVGIVGRPER